MKKLLCATLTTCIIVSASFLATYADSSNGKSENSNVKLEDKSAVNVQATDTKSTVTEQKETQKPTVDSLKEQLKTKHGDKTARQELIKQIYDLKKQNKEESKMIFINGKEVVSDVPPVVKDGRTLIPVRAITEALGAKVEWDETTSTATITKDATVIKITLGSKVAIVNGKEVALDVAAETNNNRTIVPVRFISETFKKSVDYDEGTGTVIIEDGTSVTGSTEGPAANNTNTSTNGSVTDAVYSSPSTTPKN